MGVVGSFVKGVVAGVIGLGLVSWLYNEITSSKESENGKEEE